jgi:hypothetical protein
MQQDAYALNCKQVDDRSNGRCDISRDISEKHYRDCIKDINCFATKTVNVQNTLSSSEQAKIDIDLQQLINCGNEDCLNLINEQEAFNEAIQQVDVISGGDSKVDFDIDFEMSQTSDGSGQAVFGQDNIGVQQFFINAQDDAFVDTDGNGKDVRFEMDQTNDECDGAYCLNQASQRYNLQAIGTSEIDVNSNTGFNVNQLNNGCDEDDDVSTDEVTCTNYSDQQLNIATSGSSSAEYDSSGLSTTEQTTNCDFGIQDCNNYAESFVNIGAADESQVTLDDIEQDVYQDIDCDNGDKTFCDNTANVNLGVVASLDGEIDAEGSQVAYQSSECDGASNCDNTGDMFVGLGINNIGLSPVTGTIDTDYNQELIQTADDCFDSNCANSAIMWYFANAKDDSTLTSSSDQEITQTFDCNNQNCLNSAFIVNNAFSDGSSSVEVDGTQDLDQTNNCADASRCINSASIVSDITASGTSSIDSDFTQVVDQYNACTNGANCANDATVEYFVTAQDGAIITIDSYQRITQTNTCSTGQNCVNTGTLTNNVFASGTAQLDADSTQILRQTCNTSSGPNCLNDNTVTTSGTATNNAILNYVTAQNIQPSDGSGIASITVSRSSGTSNVGTISQTSNGDIVG